MTMRPQFASSPAMAVFTSGELATAMATRRAEASSTAPATSMRMSFWAPSPSRTTMQGQVEQDGFGEGAAKSAVSASGALPAWAVAKRSTVSLVEVSESTVVQLKLAS